MSSNPSWSGAPSRHICNTTRTVSPHLIKKISIVLVLFALIVLSDRWIFDFGVSNALKEGAVFLSRPVISVSLWIRKVIVPRFSADQIIAENIDLKKQLAQNISDQARLEQLERQVSALKTQLGVQTSTVRELVEARIHGVIRNGIVSEVYIDRGSSDGLAVGMPVIAAGNIAVGLIIDIGRDWSKVQLVDDPKAMTTVRFLGQRTLAAAKGQQNGNLRLELVGIQEKSPQDAQIVTSGYDQFPEGLLIGQINVVDVRSGNLFKIITAKMAYDIILGPEVFVISK